MYVIIFQWRPLCLECILHLMSLICWLLDYWLLEPWRYFIYLNISFSFIQIIKHAKKVRFSLSLSVFVYVFMEQFITIFSNVCVADKDLSDKTIKTIKFSININLHFLFYSRIQLICSGIDCSSSHGLLTVLYRYYSMASELCSRWSFRWNHMPLITHR